VATHPRILIAGVGNVFLGDDAFGVAVAQRLAERPLPAGVRVVDFGIRGFDLAYALLEEWDLAILVDALPRGGPPGTVYVLEPDLTATAEADAGDLPVTTHGMNPLRVLGLVRALGGRSPLLRVVGCEPATLGSDEEPALDLSEAVKAAIPEAITLIEALVREVASTSGAEG
jgi:hydrogenase maturation protease